MAISACRERGKYVGICGQGPSDHPDLAQWLVEQGIESISLNPDTVVSTWLLLAQEAADVGAARRPFGRSHRSAGSQFHAYMRWPPPVRVVAFRRRIRRWR